STGPEAAYRGSEVPRVACTTTSWPADSAAETCWSSAATSASWCPRRRSVGTGTSTQPCLIASYRWSAVPLAEGARAPGHGLLADGLGDERGEVRVAPAVGPQVGERAGVVGGQVDGADGRAGGGPLTGRAE